MTNHSFMVKATLDYLKDKDRSFVLEMMTGLLERNYTLPSFQSFISDLEIGDDFARIQYDLDHPAAYFTRSGWSERELLEAVKDGVLFNIYQRYAYGE